MSCSWLFLVIYKYYFGSALTSGRSRPSDKQGGGLLDPEIRGGGGGVLKKNCFVPSGLSLVQIKGGLGPLGPSPGSATAYYAFVINV